MKTHLPRLRRVFCAMATLALGSALSAQQPTRTEIISLLEKVADWQLAHPSRYKPVGWANAVGYVGISALANHSSSPRFRDALLGIGRKNDWQPGPVTYDADDHCIGQVYTELFFTGHDPRFIAPMIERFDFILAHPKKGSLEFDAAKNPDFHDRWSWCDALFMAPPAWLQLWKATGNKAYLDHATQEWWATSDYLYDTEEHLYFRDSTFFGPREKNGKKIFWGRGNGWVLAGLARVLQHLPSDHSTRPRFEQQFKEMAERILSCQQEDGLWRASLLDPQSYPMKETSASGFFCYAFAWGVNNHLLPRDTYAPAALKAWGALALFVEADGRLTHVQPIGLTPVHFNERNTEPYGVGAFLLAGGEVLQLLPQ